MMDFPLDADIRMMDTLPINTRWEPAMTAHAVQNVRSRQEWAEIINADWRKSIESIIQTGRDLLTAREELPNGEFGRMIEADLPFTQRTANQLMRIARHPAITDWNSNNNLPPSWVVLGRLARLSENDFADAADRGLITKDTSLRAADAVVGAYNTPKGETWGADRGSSSLPTPAEARQVARETGRLVSASDGHYYSGTTEEEGDEYVRQREARYRAMEAIQTLASMDMTPHEWLHEAKPHWFVQFSLSDIEGAMTWLQQLRADYCEKEGIVDHV